MVVVNLIACVAGVPRPIKKICVVKVVSFLALLVIVLMLAKQGML